jgi:hypothetical protein
MPMLPASSDPKSCQADGNTAVQEPNADPADLVIDDLSHDDDETITDPLGTSCYDPVSGNEEADGCSKYGTFTPPMTPIPPRIWRPSAATQAWAPCTTS